jgi:hypothetical protein
MTSKLAVLTARGALRAFCRECLGVEKGQAPFDCLSLLCPLYEAVPFRGRAMPKGKAWVDPDPDSDMAQWECEIKALAEVRPRRRPSGRMLTRYCQHHCQPEDRTDCGGVLNPGEPCEHTCPLYPWHPYKPGGPKRRVRSEKQREASRVAGRAGAVHLQNLRNQGPRVPRPS